MSQRLFYTPEELAAALRLSGETIRRRLRAGQLEGVRIGDTWRVPREQVALLIGSANLDLLDVQLDQKAGA